MPKNRTIEGNMSATAKEKGDLRLIYSLCQRTESRKGNILATAKEEGDKSILYQPLPKIMKT